MHSDIPTPPPSHPSSPHSSNTSTPINSARSSPSTSRDTSPERTPSEYRKIIKDQSAEIEHYKDMMDQIGNILKDRFPLQQIE